MTDLKLETKKFQTESGYLSKEGSKHKYIERQKRGVYRLLPLGSEYITTWLEPKTELAFGDSKVKGFLTQFPEPYRGVMRLALSAYIAKQSKIFDQEEFDGAFPGTVLIGDPGIGKTPVGEAVCRLLGLKFKDHKVDVEVITKGEFGGRSSQIKGRKWVFNPSYWFKLGYLQIEEPQMVAKKEVSNLIHFILHGDKTYKREGGDEENRVVPFVTLNLPGEKNAQTVMEKIVSVKGLEEATIKRNAVLFCNPYNGYLGDPYEFFGRVMKDIPAIDLNFPIAKLWLEPQEKKLLIKLVHRAMKPTVEYSHCDKRGLEIQILAFHALTGNKDITSATYQIVKDRLQVLESLNLVRKSWRDQFNRERLEYEAVASPEKAEAIRDAIARQEELEASIDIIDIPGDTHDIMVSLGKRHEAMLDCLRSIYETLKFPWTKVKELVPKVAEYKIKKVCSRYEAENKGFKKGVKVELKVLKEVTEDNFRIGSKVAKEYKEQVKPILVAYINEIKSLERDRLQGLSDKEIKAEIVREIEGLIKRLWKADLWASTNSVYERDAIKNLREKSGKLRSHLHTVLKHKEDSSLHKLQGELGNANLKSHDWFRDFEEESKDLGIEIATKVAKAGYDIVAGIANIFKGKGGDKGGKQPPTEPKSPPGFGGRNIDDI